MHRHTFIFALFVSLLAFSSCVPTRKMILFQENNEPVLEGEFELPPFVYKIHQGDILSLDVVSPDPNAASIFKKQGQNQVMPQPGGGGGNVGFYISGYTVDRQGEITLPLLGRVAVAGLSVEEAEQRLQRLVDEEMNDASVFVKLVNYKVSILGEVQRPGVYFFYLDRVTIIDVLSNCGDVTEFANRSHVRIIRTEGDRQRLYSIDLTDRKSLTSENFYMRPNDVVIVDPLRARGGRFNLPLLGTALSTVSSLLVLYAFIIRN